jgi:hypothetical protein
MKTTLPTQTLVRKTITRSNAGRLLSFLFVGALACCVSLALVTRAHNSMKPAPARPAIIASAAATTQAGTLERGPVQVVQFALYDVGIYPYEAHVGKGIVAVSFEDLSGGASDVVVARETGAAPETVGLVHHADHNSRGRSDFKLDPGRYQIYVTDHPENRATLIVE